MGACSKAELMVAVLTVPLVDQAQCEQNLQAHSEIVEAHIDQIRIKSMLAKGFVYHSGLQVLVFHHEKVSLRISPCCLNDSVASNIHVVLNDLLKLVCGEARSRHLFTCAFQAFTCFLLSSLDILSRKQAEVIIERKLDGVRLAGLLLID